ncbi:MAG: ROK family protein [Patescibacteria group bacterium]|nr:ROK family protein [Patescibacteria group bacterium]
MTYLLFDIGGTNMRLAVARQTKSLSALTIVRRPRNFATGIRLIKKLAGNLAAGRKIDLVVGGMAGVLDKEHTRLLRSPHLQSWVNKPLQRELSRALEAPVCLENDADLIGLGEAVSGAGRGHSIVASIAIGTGIGGTRIVDGRIDHNVFGFEPGHHFLNIGIRKHQHISPHPGDWESLVSGSAMKTRFGRPAEKINQKAIWREMAQYVAYGLVNVSVFWSPNIIVLGGSLMKRLPLSEIRRYYKKYFKMFPTLPRIVRSKLDDRAGLYGALKLINNDK